MTIKFKLSGRLIVIILAALSIISFFLPIASFATEGETFFKYTCYKLFAGINETISVSGYGSVRFEQPGDKGMFLSVLFPIIILLLAFIKSVKQKTFGLIVTICSVINIIMWNNIRKILSDTADSSGSFIDLKIGIGLIIAIVASALLIIFGAMACLDKINIDNEISDAQVLTTGVDKLSSIDLSKVKDAAAKVDLSSIKNAVNSFEFPGGDWTCTCGNVVSGGKFCPKCGNPKPATPKCPKCGAKVLPDDMFCKSCGKKLDEVEEVIETSVIEPAVVGEKSKVDVALESVQISGPTCPSCGAPVKEGYAFCLKCGTALNGTGKAGQEKFEREVSDVDKSKKLIMMVAIAVVVVAAIFLVKALAGKTKDKAERSEPNFVVEEQVPSDEGNDWEKVVEEFIDDELERNRVYEAAEEPMPEAEVGVTSDDNQPFSSYAMTDAIQIGGEEFIYDGDYTYADFIKAFENAGASLEHDDVYGYITYDDDSFYPEWEVPVSKSLNNKTNIAAQWFNPNTRERYIAYIAGGDVINMEHVREDDSCYYVRGMDIPVAVLLYEGDEKKILYFTNRAIYW